ncbi:uncharacterized protein LOC129616900 [Condylostylus longicornis]|uniref:uncharacterized protein LOC129616900 n=1 Tax=Condylostylus longicornis TaxID=2530218 RepID=UPI00244E213C|nr:uncharacterized protein LOC129616900 [Condylostylus longicornis]
MSTKIFRAYSSRGSLLPTLRNFGRPHRRCFAAAVSAELEGIAIDQIRNFGISAHVDSGKTTLTERILFYTGRINSMHEIQGGDGVGAKMDSMELERERGITIQSAATFTNWSCGGLKHHFNIIDTPGHIDFQIEVERSLRVLDGAILVVCGLQGVQAQTYTVDRQMKRYGVPRICFINKLDKELSEPWKTVEQLREKLGMKLVPIQVPIGRGSELKGIVDVIDRTGYQFAGRYGEKRETMPIPPEFKAQIEEVRSELIETIANLDEKFGDLYLEKGEAQCSAEDIRAGIRRLTIQREMGTLRKGIPIYSPALGKRIPMKKMYRMHSNEAEEIQVARAGDIVAISGMDVSTGTTLCDESLDVTLSSMYVPDTSVFHSRSSLVLSSIQVSGSADVIKFNKAIKRFQREDPTFKVTFDDESKESLLCGMGELHLEIYAERMRREYGIDVKLGELQLLNCCVE